MSSRVLSGGTVTAHDLTIGNANPASSGNVDVEGVGSTLQILGDGNLNIGVAGGGSGILTIGTNATLSFAGTIVEAGHASFNNNGGLVDPDTFEFTTASNAGLGENDYSLYLGNIGAVQIADGTGVWNAAMLLTGTSVADAAGNIDNDTRGQWQLSNGGTLVINANTVDAGQVIVFEDNTDTLVIGQVVDGGSAGIGGQAPVVLAGAENLLQAGGFQAAIWGYRAGDQILFDNLAVVSDQIVNGNTLELLGAGNTDLGQLVFRSKAGDAPLGKTAMAAAAAQMACFATGTLIETVDGPRAVETLAVGDEVVTLLGGPGRIVWVVSRAVDCARHPRPEAVWPVRIAAGAFGENVPARDLFVSPDHGVFVNGVLVPIRLLINGTNIVQMKWPRVVYYHVELPEHAVILAEGLSVESYLETGDRANFDQDGAAIRLFVDFSGRPGAEGRDGLGNPGCSAVGDHGRSTGGRAADGLRPRGVPDRDHGRRTPGACRRINRFDRETLFTQGGRLHQPGARAFALLLRRFRRLSWAFHRGTVARQAESCLEAVTPQCPDEITSLQPNGNAHEDCRV